MQVIQIPNEIAVAQESVENRSDLINVAQNLERLQLSVFYLRKREAIVNLKRHWLRNIEKTVFFFALFEHQVNDGTVYI